jgi:hypothetical protein
MLNSNGAFMQYRIIYSISDSSKRSSIERFLTATGFRPHLPFSSMTATLELPLAELRRKLKKLRHACLLSKHDSLVLIVESEKQEVVL